MSCEVSDDIKRNVRAVLLSKDGGVVSSTFLSDYRKLLDEPLAFKKFGFLSLDDFIKSMPEVARIQKTPKGIKFFGVNDPSCYMPVSVRKAQGRLPKDYHRNLLKESTTQNITSTDQGCVSVSGMDKVEPDHAGLFSVCLPMEQCPTHNPQDLEMIFSQAGDVKRSMYTKKWVFVRYARKEEVFKAQRLFGAEYGVRIATNSKKEKEKRLQEEVESNIGDVQDGFVSNSTAEEKSMKYQGKNQQKGKTKMDPSHGETTKAASEKINHVTSFEKNSQNGLLPHIKHQEKNDKSSASSTESDCQRSEKTELFVANIEHEEEFKEMVKAYSPVQVKVLSKGPHKLFAFLSMRNESEARRVIGELNNMKQGKKALLVDFNKSTQNGDDGVDSGSPTAKPQQKPRNNKKTQKMPELQTDYSDMPPLMHVSKLGADPEKYQIDCSIYVANFPKNSLESSLRKAFESYHVLDICMINNGSAPGCTKAFLYLATVYDVVLAVGDMNGSCVLGNPLKVAVPFKNTLLKTVVDKALMGQQRPFMTPFQQS